MRRIFSLGLATVCTLVVLGCGGGGGSDKGKGTPQADRLDASGATFIRPMMKKWIATYKEKKGVEINYQASGSGTGIKQMIEKKNDFGCSDAPLNPEQLATAQKKGGDVLHIPLAMGAVVPTYNLPGVEKPVRFTGEVLAKIYLGVIKNWSDKELQDLQEEGIKLPDLDINVVHRSDGSGTTYIFADYLCKVSPTWEKTVGKGTSLKWPTGIGAQENAGVASHVKNNKGAIGYNELIYALENNIKYGAVKNKKGHYIRGSLESVTAAAETTLNEMKDFPEDLRYSLTDAPGAKSYPIAGTNWAILYVNQPTDKGSAIKEFLHWVTHEGQALCPALHYAPLPPSLVNRLEKRLALLKFGG